MAMAIDQSNPFARQHFDDFIDLDKPYLYAVAVCGGFHRIEGPFWTKGGMKRAVRRMQAWRKSLDFPSHLLLVGASAIADVRRQYPEWWGYDYHRNILYPGCVVQTGGGETLYLVSRVFRMPHGVQRVILQKRQEGALAFAWRGVALFSDEVVKVHPALNDWYSFSALAQALCQAGFVTTEDSYVQRVVDFFGPFIRLQASIRQQIDYFNETGQRIKSNWRHVGSIKS